MYLVKATIMRFTLANLSEKGWLQAMSAIKYYKKRFFEDKFDVQFSNMILDINRAFVLYCCTFVNYFIMKGNEEKVITYAKMAVFDAV